METSTAPKTARKPKTPPPPPTYTHIVHLPDRLVSHNFSLSGWNENRRHAGNVKKGGYSFVFETVCGKTLNCDPENYFNMDEGRQKKEVSQSLRCDPPGTGWITCNACRRKLGLLPLKRRRGLL